MIFMIRGTMTAAMTMKTEHGRTGKVLRPEVVCETAGVLCLWPRRHSVDLQALKILYFFPYGSQIIASAISIGLLCA